MRLKKICRDTVLWKIWGLTAILVIVFAGAFIHQILTILMMSRLEGTDAYRIHYYGDYALDEYIEANCGEWNFVEAFLQKEVGFTKGKALQAADNCSVFFAQTPEGDFVLARNLDSEDVIPAVITTAYTEHNRTIGVTNLKRGGWEEGGLASRVGVLKSPYYTLDGMNEHGLAIASSSIPNFYELEFEEAKATVHDLTVNRIILDKAKNVDEAIAILKGLNVFMEKIYPSHYLIADASGRSVIVEFVADGMQVIEGSELYQIITNSLVYGKSKDVLKSCDRYREYDEMLAEMKGRIRVKDALELLKENVVPGKEKWSVIYNLTRGTMTITFADNYEKVYVFDMKEGMEDDTREKN